MCSCCHGRVRSGEVREYAAAVLLGNDTRTSATKERLSLQDALAALRECEEDVSSNMAVCGWGSKML
jgi:hypothetical protein